MFAAIDRHIRGDFGEVPEEDRRHDEFAVQRGERILSVYHSRAGRKFYVITEGDRAGDRSATTVLLPEDY